MVYLSLRFLEVYSINGSMKKLLLENRVEENGFFQMNLKILVESTYGNSEK